MTFRSMADVCVGMRVQVLSDSDEVIRLCMARMKAGRLSLSERGALAGQVGEVVKVDVRDSTVMIKFRKRSFAQSDETQAWFAMEALTTPTVAESGESATCGHSVLESMWRRGEFTDAEVRCGETSFPVHRAVLSAVSPVFAAMFRSSMQEGVQAQISITDSSEVAVKVLLDFVYTFQLGPDFPLEVLELAHKYEIQRLVAECCQCLTQSVNCKNVTPVLRVLRLRREHAEVKRAWDAIIDKLCNEKVMVRAICEEV